MSLAETSSVAVERRDRVSVQHDPERTVIWLYGEHDISTMAALSETLARAIAFDDADLVIDLGGVEFMGVETVGVLIRTRDFLRAHSRSLDLRAPSPRAQRILELCGWRGRRGTGPFDAMRATGTADALGTWVVVPTTDRVDQRADPFSSRRRSRPFPARAGRVTIPKRVPAASERVTVPTTSAASHEGP